MKQQFQLALYSFTSESKNVARGLFRAAGYAIAAWVMLGLAVAANAAVFAMTAFIARSSLGEYGIRAALGAAPSALLRFGFREAAWLLGIGLPIGVTCAWLLGGNGTQ